MLAETIKILFTRHGIPFDDVDLANDKIDSIVFDNPSVLFPQSRKNGIYEIDWTNSILYVREHRKDVLFDDHDSVEMALEFDNIQRILFKLNEVDYKNISNPGEAKVAVIAAVNAYEYTLAEFNLELQEELRVNYTMACVDEVKRISVLNSNMQLVITGASDKVMKELADDMLVISDDMFADIQAKILIVKKQVIDDIDNIMMNFDSVTLLALIKDSISQKINKDTVDKIFLDNSIVIADYIRHALHVMLNDIMIKDKHESGLEAEVNIQFTSNAHVNAEMTYAVTVPTP